MDPTPRALVAIRIPANHCAQLGAVIESLARRAPGLGITARWVKPSGYHVPLAYLGFVHREVFTAVSDVVREVVAGFDAFPNAPTFAVQELLAVPSPSQATLLAANVSSAWLTELSQKLRSELTAIGFTFDPAWSPHVAVARFAPAAALGPLFVGADPFSFEVRADSLDILETSSKTNSYDYSVIKSFGLSKGVDVGERQRGTVQTSKYDAGLFTEDGWLPTDSRLEQLVDVDTK